MSLCPLFGVAVPDLRTEALAFDSDSREEENVAVAETQSFVLQNGAGCSDGNIRETTQASSPATTEDEMSKKSCREESFRLGLFDSSHLPDPLQALAMENTQAFVSVEATQLYAATSHANQTPSANDSEPEATQAYGVEEEPAICSVVPEREGRGDLSLEPTQAYVSEPDHYLEDETDEDEKRAIATEETQPFYLPTSATPLAMAETQPMCVSEEGEEVKFPLSTAVRVEVKSKKKTEERGEHSKAVRSQERPSRELLSLAETQPMFTSDDRESDEEDSFPGQRKSKPKQLQIEDEQTQSLTSSEQSLVQTQPLQSADENLAPPGSFCEDFSVAVFQNSEELQKKPALITSDPSLAETQLMITGEDEESEESISFLALPRRKAKPLWHLEEETQTLLETQPMSSGGDGDGLDSLPGTGRTEANAPQVLQEKTELLTNSESSIRETQLLETEAGSSGTNVDGRRGTRAGSRKVPTQPEEPARRRTRGRKEAVSAAAPRGKSKSSDEEREEEQKGEEEEHPKEGGGMKSRRQRIDVDKNEADNSPIKKQGEGSLGEKRSETDLRQHLRENEEEERKEADEKEKINLEIKEEKESIEPENAQGLRLEWERAEREKMEKERKEQEERAERRKETEQKEREDRERLQNDRAEREDKERLEREKQARMSSDRKDQEEKERLESEHDEKHEREGQRHSARQESEAKERDSAESSEKGKATEEKLLREQEEDKAKVSARGRRAARRTAATEPAKGSATSTNDDVPARRTRSRSNSVSSETSASSVPLQESRGRGRGRGARTTAHPPQALASRSSNRRKTVGPHPTQVDSCDGLDVSGGLFRSNSSNSSLHQSSQGRGRVSRQRPRGGTAEADSDSPAISQSDLKTKTTTRGRKNNKAESSQETEKAAASRGRWRSSSNGSETEGCSNQGQRVASEESQKNVRGRSQKSAKSEAVLVPGSPAAGNLDETKELRKGRKRESEAKSQDDSGSSSKFFKGEERELASGEAEEAVQAQNQIPLQVQRRGRASTAQKKKIPKAFDTGAGAKERNERTVEEAVERGPGRPSAAQKKPKEEQVDTETSADQHARVLEPEVT